MEKDRLNTQLLLSIILTIFYPILGIVSLCYAISSVNKYKKDDNTYNESLKKSYRWAKIGVIVMIATWIFFTILLICLYFLK